jgi:hypothetical protein
MVNPLIEEFDSHILAGEKAGGHPQFCSEQQILQ